MSAAARLKYGVDNAGALHGEFQQLAAIRSLFSVLSLLFFEDLFVAFGVQSGCLRKCGKRKI